MLGWFLVGSTGVHREGSGHDGGQGQTGGSDRRVLSPHDPLVLGACLISESAPASENHCGSVAMLTNARDRALVYSPPSHFLDG